MNNLQLSIRSSQQRENRNPENTSVKTAVKILKLLEENPSMTLAEVASIIQKSQRAVELASSGLVKDGKLRHIGPQKGVYLTQPSESAALTSEFSGEVARLLLVWRETMSRRELREALLLEGDDNFRRLYLLPDLEAGLVEMTVSGKPNSRLQKYRLMAKA